MKEGLKLKLITYLKENGVLSRTEAIKLAAKWKYMASNAERRLREIVEDYSVIPLNRKGKPCKNSDWIAAWKWVGAKTVFNKK